MSAAWIEAVIEALPQQAETVADQFHIGQAGLDELARSQSIAALAVHEKAELIALRKQIFQRAACIQLKESGIALEQFQTEIGAERCVEGERKIEAQLQILRLVLQFPPVDLDRFATAQRVPQPKVQITGDRDLSGVRVGLQTKDAVDRTRAFRIEKKEELGGLG